MKPIRIVAAATLYVATLWSALPAVGSDRVVASIKPIHSLVAAVMGDTGEPFLIIRGGASPHTFSLRPSVAKKISTAQLIFWIGETLEISLAKPVRALSRRARLVTLSRAPGVTRVPLREGGLFDAHGPDGHDHHAEEEFDNHSWLDPANAKIFAGQIEQALVTIDPENAARYRANADVLRKNLDVLIQDIRKTLRPVKGRPFIVFHDAYQYFERRFGLSAAGSIVINPDRAPGARRLSAIRTKIQQSGALCVFSEPQFTPRLVSIVVRGTRARTGVLDPVGADLPDGPDLYFKLMRNMATAFANCLGASAASR